MFYSNVYILCSFWADAPPILEDTEATIASCKAAGQWQFAVLLLSEVTARRLQTDAACLQLPKLDTHWHFLIAQVFVWFMFGFHLQPAAWWDRLFLTTTKNNKQKQTVTEIITEIDQFQICNRICKGFYQKKTSRICTSDLYPRLSWKDLCCWLASMSIFWQGTF